MWFEARLRVASRPTVKQELAGVRRLFDWLTVRQVVSTSPAAAVHGPKHIVRRGTTSALFVAECRDFLRPFQWRPLEAFATGPRLQP